MERLLDYFVPERYKLDIGVDKFNKKIGGAVEIIGQVLSETVKFHAVGITVMQVLADGEKIDYEVADGLLTLKKVPRSVSSILVVYYGTLNENMQGAYLSTYQNQNETEVIVATQFESHYAREAFPCIDEPAAKAVFELTLTVPEVGDTVLANIPVDSTKKYGKVPDGKHIVFYDDDGKKSVGKYLEYKFLPTPRMSTYLLAWVVGKFQEKTTTNRHGVEITTYAALNQDVDSVDYANEVAARSLEFYDDNFGVPYPLPKLTQVALPDFEAGAMENWGLVTYRESMLLVGKNAALDTKKGVALTVAHELSHQWFGNLVTMRWWDDLWLNESFATIMEYYAVDVIYPEYHIFEEFFTHDALAALRRDAYTGVQAVHQEVKSPEEIATLFDPAIVYAKGARLMLMLVRMMGWAEFCRGIHGYFEKYKYDNTVGDDLWRALEPHAEFEVGELMHAYIDKPGYPVIRGNDDFAEYTEARFTIDSKIAEGVPGEEPWPLHKVSEDMTGHYVLGLSDDEFSERLARFDKLGLEEKLRLLIDRDLVSKTRLAPSASLLPLVDKFQKEESAAVWSVVLTIVSGLKAFFESGSGAERKYKDFVGRLVAPGLARVGLVTCEGDDDNTVRLRAILLALDFYAETEENLARLAEMYDKDYGRLDANIRADILDAKAFREPEVVSEYIEEYRRTADPEVKYELLLAGALVKDEGALDKMCDLLGNTDAVKPQDQFHLFLYLYRNPQARARVAKWLEGNWGKVREMSGDKSLEDYPRYIAGAVRTEAEYKWYQDFFGPMRDDPALARAIEVGENEIRARLALIAEDGEAVRRKLDEIRMQGNKGVAA